MILATAVRNAMLDAATALLGGGTLQLQTSANAPVATLTLSNPAFAAASNGSATAYEITSDTNAAGGTVAHAYLRKADTTELIKLTVTATGGGGEITMSSLVVGAGGTIGVQSFVLSKSAS